MNRRFPCLLLAALLCCGAAADAASVVFDFEDGTDQGFGHKFGSGDASEDFPIVDVGGSKRMQVLRSGDFQEADQSTGNTSSDFFMAMDAALNNPSGYVMSYDWYVDTSAGNQGTFLQLGTYINSGGGSYTQDFPGTGKDVELNGTQLASGGVFSGTVAETFTQKYGAIGAGFLGQTFLRMGLIINGDGAVNVHFDNVSVRPVPEPTTTAVAATALSALACCVRRKP